MRMRRNTCLPSAMVTSRSQTIRRRLGSVTLTVQGLGFGLGTSLFPVGATEIKDLPWQPSRRIAGFNRN